MPYRVIGAFYFNKLRKRFKKSVMIVDTVGLVFSIKSGKIVEKGRGRLRGRGGIIFGTYSV